MSRGNLISGYAMTGTPLPISLGGGGDDGYSAGNIGLNYLFPKWPNAPLNPNSNYCENENNESETESGFEGVLDKKPSPAVNKVINVVLFILVAIILWMAIKGLVSPGN